MNRVWMLGCLEASWTVAQVALGKRVAPQELQPREAKRSCPLDNRIEAPHVAREQVRLQYQRPVHSCNQLALTINYTQAAQAPHWRASMGCTKCYWAMFAVMLVFVEA